MTPIEIFGLGFSVLFFILWITSHSSAKKAQAVAVADAAKFKITAAEERTQLEKSVTMRDSELRDIKEKFANIISVEDEIARLANEARETELRIKRVQLTYAEKRKILEQLEAQVAIFDDRLAFAEMGVYEPHFEFNDTEEFKEEIQKVRGEQKALISAKNATICPTEWSVEGSKSKGQTMINRQIRLTMRAFNNECDAAVANVRWNNASAMEKGSALLPSR